jgi:hypothetical protein
MNRKIIGVRKALPTPALSRRERGSRRQAVGNGER